MKRTLINLLIQDSSEKEKILFFVSSQLKNQPFFILFSLKILDYILPLTFLSHWGVPFFCLSKENQIKKWAYLEKTLFKDYHQFYNSLILFAEAYYVKT